MAVPGGGFVPVCFGARPGDLVGRLEAEATCPVSGIIAYEGHAARAHTVGRRVSSSDRVHATRHLVLPLLLTPLARKRHTMSTLNRKPHESTYPPVTQKPTGYMTSRSAGSLSMARPVVVSEALGTRGALSQNTNTKSRRDRAGPGEKFQVEAVPGLFSLGTLSTPRMYKRLHSTRLSHVLDATMTLLQPVCGIRRPKVGLCLCTQTPRPSPVGLQESVPIISEEYRAHGPGHP